MYNKVVLMGRLVRDADFKTTPNGISVATFSIAVERAYSTKGEEKQTDFFNIVAWRHTAEFVSKYFSKGRMILIEGELQNRKYTDKNGIEKQITEIIANQARFTGEAKAQQNNNNNNNYNYNYTNTNQNSAATVQDAIREVTEVTGDIPDYPF